MQGQDKLKARVLEQAGYDMSLNSPDWGSIQYQNANNSVRATDQFMEAVVEGKEWNADRAHRRLGRRNDRCSRPAAPDRRGGVGVRGSGRSVRHDDQLLAHTFLRILGASTCSVSCSGVHVHRRLGVQPRRTS